MFCVVRPGPGPEQDQSRTRAVMLTSCCLLLVTVARQVTSPAIPPVNRPFHVYAGQFDNNKHPPREKYHSGEPTPNLSCVVGFVSLDTKKTYK